MDALGYRLGDSRPGEHSITSRATDIDGEMQPAPDDPFLASKRTYWESNGQITRRVNIPSVTVPNRGGDDSYGKALGA